MQNKEENKVTIEVVETKAADLKEGQQIIIEHPGYVLLPKKDTKEQFEVTQVPTAKFYTIIEALSVNKGKKVSLTYKDHTEGKETTELVEADANVVAYNIVKLPEPEKDNEQAEDNGQA